MTSPPREAASPAITRSHRLDEPESSQNLLQARIKEPFERHPALASWIERLGNTQMELPLGDWMVFIGALNLALSASETRAQKAEGELARMREALTRLGSMEAFTISRCIDKERDAELLARIDFARQALLPSDKTLTQSSTS